MKLVDANVLLYAVNRDAPQHASARDWLDEALSGGARVAFCWVVLLAFLRLSTNGRIFDEPLSASEAIAQAEDWLAQPSASSKSCWPHWRRAAIWSTTPIWLPSPSSTDAQSCPTTRTSCASRA